MPDRDWKDELIDAAAAAGLKASLDDPDAILMADARSNLLPGSVTRAACAPLVRAACNAQGLTLLGYDAGEILTIVAAAAAKLEMRASADG